MFDFDMLSDEELAKRLYTIWRHEMQVEAIHTWEELKASPHINDVKAWERVAKFVKEGF